MGFFQWLGIVVFCLFLCAILFLGLLVCTNYDLADAFVLYAIFITLIFSGLIALFVVTPNSFGYEIINTEIVEQEVEE